MEKTENKGMNIKDVSDKIEQKRETYISLIKSTFTFSAKNDEEKKQIADDKFTAEKELYLMRLSEYAIEEPAAKLSLFQGVNIFLEVLQTGLSFSVAANHIYLSIMKGSRGEVDWKMTSDAAVYLAQRVGAISHISDVVIVFKDEEFEVYNENGEFKVKHSLKFRDGEIKYSDFLCGYVYVVYPSGERELRIVNRQQMDDAYKMSNKKDNYNKISMLKSKVVRRALRFDRKVVIESMVNSVASPLIKNVEEKDFDLKFAEPTEVIDEEENKEQPQGQNNLTQGQADLLSGLDLNF